ncbi:protein PTHB1 isoform X2 [Photinus pyralis]|uniref:protein PTHB1 isoform X2 n=1 Tax=Photinus pyralis TaxID=7054 RepID=UPI0012677B2C|nr:protein PTHB1 isoform X2 [Photinus pyralis]
MGKMRSTSFNRPICLLRKFLQIQSCKFQLDVWCRGICSGSTKTYIAVLYPRTISVYGFVSKEGATEHGTQNMLPIIYEHKLKRSAANFCVGPFGGSFTRDFICIQSLDGLLIFFEQESFAFCCFLPQFLLPGPLIYIKKTDAFLTMSSTWHLTNFSYKNLSEAGHDTHEDDCSGTKIAHNWAYNVGEDVIDLHYVLDAYNEGYIIAVGEKHLFCLSESGILKFVKKLDYTPICMHAYTLDVENSVWTLIASETGNLFIYLNTTLKWSAQLPILPTALKRATFKNVNGALVILSEDGNLHCSYLGTQPHLFSTPPLANQELDYEKVEAELLSLTRIIRNYYSSDNKLTNITNETELQMTVTVTPQFSAKASDFHPNCTVSVSVTPNVILEEIQVTILVQKPLKCTKQIEYYRSLTDKVTFESNVSVDTSPRCCPSLNVEVISSVLTNLGVPKVIRKSVELPLRLFFCKTEVAKENRCKVTLDINQETVPLSILFPEFTEGQTALVNEIRLKSRCESVVTVMKHSNKYRVFSDSLLNLNLVVQSLITRLNKHFANENNFVLSFNDKLPIVEFLSHVREHFARNQAVADLRKKLIQLSGQFRIIQKRLITKFKDKNPTSLSNMEKLLQQTYTDIIQTGTDLELELGNLQVAQLHLSTVLHLMVLLMRLMNVNKNLTPILETTFCSCVYDIETQNWEDVLETSLCYILRSMLSSTEGEKIKLTTSVEVQNVEQLELHIRQVLERMQLPNTIPEEQAESDPVQEQDNNEIVSLGSKLGVSSSRAVSAKRRVMLTTLEP